MVLLIVMISRGCISTVAHDVEMKLKKRLITIDTWLADRPSLLKICHFWGNNNLIVFGTGALLERNTHLNDNPIVAQTVQLQNLSYH